MESLDYPMFAENGQEYDTATTKVIEFPVKAPNGKTKNDISAIEQLEFYKITMENYTDQNSSITVHVRDNEWEDVKVWLFNNWDCIVGVSLIQLDNSYYQLLPYESITEEEYNNRMINVKKIKIEHLAKFEKTYEEMEFEAECASGACPIR